MAIRRMYAIMATDTIEPTDFSAQFGQLAMQPLCHSDRQPCFWPTLDAVLKAAPNWMGDRGTQALVEGKHPAYKLAVLAWDDEL